MSRDINHVKMALFNNKTKEKEEVKKAEEENIKEDIREVEINLTLLNAKLNYLISLLENINSKVDL
jgi:endonuclease III